MIDAHDARVPGLSVFIIAFNEAGKIGEVLAAASGLASETVVVNSLSTDTTVEIARAAGARVVVEPWRGYGPQKRFAENQCAGPWLLNLDADEFVPPALAQEIRELFAHGEPRHPAYQIAIANQLPYELEPRRFASGPRPVRLYRKDAGRYRDSLVHDRVELLPGRTVGRLRHRIHHRSILSMSQQVAKLNAYTDLQVADLAARGRRLSRWRLVFEMPISFLRYYVLRRYFIYGSFGFSMAVNAAFLRYLRIAKAIELQSMQRMPANSGVRHTDLKDEKT